MQKKQTRMLIRSSKFRGVHQLRCRTNISQPVKCKVAWNMVDKFHVEAKEQMKLSERIFATDCAAMGGKFEAQKICHDSAAADSSTSFILLSFENSRYIELIMVRAASRASGNLSLSNSAATWRRVASPNPFITSIPWKNEREQQIR